MPVLSAHSIRPAAEGYNFLLKLKRNRYPLRMLLARCISLAIPGFVPERRDARYNPDAARRFVSSVDAGARPRRGAAASRGVGWGRTARRSVTVSRAGRGRRTPKISVCARACTSVQDARRAGAVACTPTSLCSPVTFAEAAASSLSPPLRSSPSSLSSFSIAERSFAPWID